MPVLCSKMYLSFMFFWRLKEKYYDIGPKNGRNSIFDFSWRCRLSLKTPDVYHVMTVKQGEKFKHTSMLFKIYKTYNDEIFYFLKVQYKFVHIFPGNFHVQKQHNMFERKSCLSCVSKEGFSFLLKAQYFAKIGCRK